MKWNAIVLIFAMLLQAVMIHVTNTYFCTTKEGRLVVKKQDVVVLIMYYTITATIGVILLRTILKTIPSQQETLNSGLTLLILALYGLIVTVPLVIGILLIKGQLNPTDSRYVFWGHYTLTFVIYLFMLYLNHKSGVFAEPVTKVIRVAYNNWFL